MPRKNQTKKTTAETPISKWLFWAPLKFTALFSVLVGLFAFIINLFPITISTNSWIIISVMSIICAFSLYKIIRWTPDDKMDHKSFVMLNISQSIIGMFLMIIIGFASIRMHLATSWDLAVTMGLIALIMIIYLGGLGILKIKALFCRARMHDVPKWKLWLSVPFGIGIFWYSGFLVSDNKKKNPILKTYAKPFDNLISWIIAKPRNTMITFFILIASAGLMMIYDSIMMGVFFVISLILMLILMFWKKIRNNIGGGFATVAIALNLAVIISIISAAIYTAPKQQIIVGEQIEITEVNK